jgi:hypothetical protein
MIFSFPYECPSCKVCGCRPPGLPFLQGGENGTPESLSGYRRCDLCPCLCAATRRGPLNSFTHHPKPCNECPAVAVLRTINTAEVTYQSSSGRYGTITDLIDAKLLDDTFTGTRAGYNYCITLDATGSGYTAEAMPASAKTGRYGYYSVPDAVVRYSTNVLLAPKASKVGKPVK